MKQYDVVALGELLIDFTQNGLSPQGNPLFEANPGGAPCNVLAMLTGLGDRTAFIGKVGNDGFGHQLKQALTEVGIGTEGLCMDDAVHTTLAIVQTKADGDRDFSFYRKPGADMMLTEKEVRPELLSDCRIFHFGSLSMTDEGVRAATKHAIQVAKEAGALISFDPNLRPPLWDSLDAAKEQIAYGMKQCQILKISDDEITWFTGETDYEKAARRLQSEYDIPLVFVSLGSKGSQAYCGETAVTVEPFLQEGTIETTGAGDTFMGCMLHQILKKGTFDPNLRPPLWDSLDAAKEQIAYGMKQCQILKISDDEITWFTGETDYEKAARRLQSEYDIPLVFVSLGSKGSQAYCGETAVTVEPFLQEGTIETTGAGDTFMGCMLHQILKKGTLDLTKEDLREMLVFANAAASLITTKKGALRVMPKLEEIKALIAERR